MNSHERVCEALKRRQPDRVPIFTGLDGESRNISDKLRRFILAHTDVYYTRLLYTGFQCTGLAPIKTEKQRQDGWIDVVYDFGGSAVFTETYRGGTGEYIGLQKHLFAEPEDLDRILRLPYVKPEDNVYLREWIGEVNSSGSRYSANGAFLRLVVMDPLNSVAGYTNPTDFAAWTMDCPARLLAYMDTVLERQLEYLRYALKRLKAPIVANISGGEFAIPPLMSPTGFKTFVLPYDRELVRLIHEHDQLVYYHCHGKVRRFLRGFIEMGVDGLHPLEPVGNTGDCDLAEVKRKIGTQLCLIGNVQYDDFARLSGAEMAATVRAAMSAAKEGGGFILCLSCTPYHNPLPAAIEDNIVRFVETGLEFGRY